MAVSISRFPRCITLHFARYCVFQSANHSEWRRWILPGLQPVGVKSRGFIPPDPPDAAGRSDECRPSHRGTTLPPQSHHLRLFTSDQTRPAQCILTCWNYRSSALRLLHRHWAGCLQEKDVNEANFIPIIYFRVVSMVVILGNGTGAPLSGFIMLRCCEEIYTYLII